MSSNSLTTSMKATGWLIISFMVYFVGTGVTDVIRRGVWDIGILLSFVIFLPVLLVLLAFCRKGRRWAYLGTVIFGLLIVVATGASTLGNFEVEFSSWTTWGSMLANVLSILMALEGFKAYVEARSSAGLSH